MARLRSDPAATRRLTMRPLRLAACALLAAARARLARPPPLPRVQMTWGVHISLAPTWFDPAETQGIITPFLVMYAIHDAMAKSMPGQPDRAEPGRVVADVARRARLRLHAAQGREVPQRRHAHLRGREVLVRALPRGRRQGAQGPRRRGGDARSAAGAVPAEEPVARLHDVLHRGQRRRLDRAEEVRREGRRRRLQEGARWAPGRTSSSRSRRASSWSWRPSTATGARRRA